MTKSVNIVIGNHAGSRGISDYVHYLRFTLTKMGINVTESIYPKVHVDANFWIEDFGCSSGEFLKVNAAKFPPSYLVCTEWPSRLRTFNCFSFQEKIFSAVLFLLPVRFLVMNILLSKGRFTRRIAQMGVGCLISFGYLLGFNSRKSFQQLELSSRFTGLKNIAQKWSGFIVVNESLADAYNTHFPDIPTHVLAPLLKKSWMPLADNTERDRKSAAWAFVSGNVTRHRARWIDRALLRQQSVTTIPPYLSRTFARTDKENLGQRSYNTELKNIFCLGSECLQNTIFLGYYSRASFLDEIANTLPEMATDKSNSEGVRSAESLRIQYAQQIIFLEIYVGQTKKWYFSSPMRDYRALRKGYIPINSGSYQGQLFENLVIAAPKKPNDFIDFLHSLEVGELIRSMPALVDQHNARFLASNRKAIDAIL